MKFSFVFAVVIAVLMFLNSDSYSQVEKTVRIKNMTGSPISSVRISPNDQYIWSLPLNTTEKVADNAYFEYKRKIDTSNCIYDFKFDAEDGTEYILENLNLCETDEIHMIIPKKEE